VIFSLKLLNETYSTEAIHKVTAEGTYYACVVAYNRALEPSKPLCSDGVTVTSVVPKVREVVISGAYVKGGLLTDTHRNLFWVIEKNRYRKLVKNPTQDCRYKIFQTILLI
jgi:hypothetical protein